MEDEIMQSLLSPENNWAIWAVLLSTAAFGIWAERTQWGAKLSGAVIAIGVTFALSNLYIIPVSAPAYDAVWKYIVQEWAYSSYSCIARRQEIS